MPGQPDSKTAVGVSLGAEAFLGNFAGVLVDGSAYSLTLFSGPTLSKFCKIKLVNELTAN